jgi:hypothetical protein
MNSHAYAGLLIDVRRVTAIQYPPIRLDFLAETWKNLAIITILQPKITNRAGLSPVRLGRGDISMWKRLSGMALLGVILSGAGCTMCCHPYDYCGPVYQPGCDGKPFCSPCRCGSILDGCGWRMCPSCRAQASQLSAAASQQTAAPQSTETLEPVPEPMSEQSPAAAGAEYSEGNGYRFAQPADDGGAAEPAEESREGPSLWIALPDEVQRR